MPIPLEQFVGSNPDATGLPFNLIDYLELADWTGRLIKPTKRGYIDASLPPRLQRLSLDIDAWKILTTKFEAQFRQGVGSEHVVRRIYTDKHYQRTPSTKHHRNLLG